MQFKDTEYIFALGKESKIGETVTCKIITPPDKELKETTFKILDYATEEDYAAMLREKHPDNYKQQFALYEYYKDLRWFKFYRVEVLD